MAVNDLKDKYPNIKLKVENPAVVREMMGGMMTEPEKKKHAKNMKRLSKDMSKLKGNNYGGGGYKVPNYVKGTLTRKYYENIEERKLTKKEKRDKEKIVKGLKGRKDLDKSDKYAIATAQAKKMEEMTDDEFEKAKEADRLEKHPERDKIKKVQRLIKKQIKELWLKN